MDRCFASDSGSCVIPGVQIDKPVYGRIQEGKFQRAEVRRVRVLLVSAYARIAVCSLTTHRLTFSSVLEEIPVRIRTNPLTSGFLQALAAPGTTVSIPGETGSLSVMDLGHSGVSRSLEQVAEAIDNFRTEDGNVGYLTRQIAREKVRAEAYVAKRREENAQRVAEGLSPLPEEDVSRLFKIPSEPSRLESMLLLGQVDAHGKSLETLAGLALVKMFGARVSRDFHI